LVVKDLKTKERSAKGIADSIQHHLKLLPAGRKRAQRGCKRCHRPERAVVAILAFFFLTLELPGHDSARLKVTAHSIHFGVYDFEQILTNNSKFGTEHIFVSWKDYKNGSLTNQLNVIRSRGRVPLVTIEPWGSSLEETISGSKDGVIRQMATEVSEFRDPVTIRFMHECENGNGRYPWACRDSGHFIAAFRHFVTRFRTVAENAKFMWSPIADPGCERYYPGSEYVDEIGLSFYSFPEADLKYHGHVRSFKEQMDQKYDRVRWYDKPIVIAEFGIAGSDDAKTSYLSEVLLELPKYPLVTTLVFFVAKDTPGAWGQGISTPRWSLGTGELALLH
jgi:endoglucanase